MAGQRTLPNMGLKGFWSLGDNTWKPDMDKNLLVLSSIGQGVVLSRLAAEPGTPADGDVHIATTNWSAALTAANVIVIRDAGAWVEVIPQAGWRMYDQATNEALVYDGSAWADSAPPGLSIITDGNTDRVLSNTDLAGNIIIERAAAAAQTVTVNTGLTGTEPVTIINTGGGALTITAGAGVTINSAAAKVAVNTQYASVTLIPKGSDVFHLVGALE